MTVEVSKARGQFVFSGFFIAHFACFGIVLPFLPLWMKSHGISDGDVGLILSSAFISKVVFGIAVGTLADATGHRKYWILFLAITNLIGFWVFAQTDSFWPMLIVWFVVGPLQTSMIPMIDGLAITAARRGFLNYGPARLFGSIAFIVVSSIAGVYLAGKSIDHIPTLLMIFGGIVVIAVLPLPDLRPRQKAGRRIALFDVVKIPGLMGFVMAAALLQSSHGALYAIATQHWANAGLSSDMIGFLWAEGVTAEVILFAFGAILLKKVGLRGLLWLAVIGGTIRWFTLGATTDTVVLIIVQVLHAFTFAATHLSITSYISRHVPDELTASAQTFYDGLAMGILIGLFMTVSSWLYDTAVAGHVFWIMMGISLTAGVVLVFTGKKARELGV
ncbi:MFS transporter [Curvivirga aplysinae]|uniref:MFS transporter n=1 Tax=Curvivirga aplysinae TaxID=2529852 RepID=UPI0012BD371A|nr:MFS transporter [Curvivirga aplysinae]MTI10544.1 MFS transporter [Curvivirga aplysinae]